MTDDILRELEESGALVDEGNLVSGPFIPDGRVRIYDEDTLDVLGEGATLEEAYECYAATRRSL